MRVRLKHKWFGPSEPFQASDRRIFKGVAYQPGIHELDPSYRELLPKSAEILDDEFVDPVEEVHPAPTIKEPEGDTLRDHDIARYDDDMATKRLQEAEENAARVMGRGKKK